tara:strand:+ start:3708 stop:4517 length:810 start_codon:yes stop_codon:yes gene_type:complete
MDMLDLPDVTLCCVDTRSVPQAFYALRQCMARARFGRVLFLGPKPESRYGEPPEGIDWVPIPALTGIQDYNRIVLKDLAAHIHTSHVLIVQWDGFITHPELWRPDFLSVDYIGPPWYHGGHPGMVGNGGFSLRSKRLLDALASLENLDTTEPEDMVVCVQRRSELEREHGIRFAPLDMAQDFGCEYGPYRHSFGFHGMHNFAHAMDEPSLTKWLKTATCDLLIQKHARKLVKELILSNRQSEARSLLRLRSLHLGWTMDQQLLYLRTLA